MEDLQATNSSDPLFTWSCGITSQIKYVISPYSEELLAPK